jgi:tetraacyldisaccharide 4'-kinase
MSGSWRADMLVITKCPETLAESDQIALIQRVKPLPDQPVFFTSIAYLPLRDRKGSDVSREITGQTTVFLLTGIARSEPMVNYIRQFTSDIIHHKYPDHHPYSLKNLAKLASEFNACPSVDKVIITTEKDAQRLATEELLPTLNTLPVLVLPIGVKFLKDGEYFNRLISDYVRKYRKNNRVH